MSSSFNNKLKSRLSWGRIGGYTLLLAEGGYAPTNPPEWIARLRLGVALLSVAAGDRRGLPDAETLEALAGYCLLRTD
jgi:hypothetical protein